MYSPSDLDADDEDNQDYDSTVNQSDSTMSLHQETLAGRCRATNGRPDTPDMESLEEVLFAGLYIESHYVYIKFGNK